MQRHNESKFRVRQQPVRCVTMTSRSAELRTTAAWFQGRTLSRSVGATARMLLEGEAPCAIGLCGPMFAGKTSLMLWLGTKKGDVLAFKAAGDDRYGAVERITTHDGVMYSATSVYTCLDVLMACNSRVRPPTLVLLDEIQFLGSGEDIVAMLRGLLESGTRVVYTCVKSARGTAAKVHAALSAACSSDDMHLFELFGACYGCSGVSTAAVRYVPDPEHPERPLSWVGGADKYVSLCSDCVLAFDAGRLVIVGP
jgi:thymidine kinase